MRTGLLSFLLLAGCAAPAAQGSFADAPLGWVCQRSYPGEGHHFWVNRLLSADGTPVGNSAGWRASATQEAPGTDLFWQLPETGPWHSRPDFIRLDFSLRRAPRGPVEALLFADARLIARREVIDRRFARAFRRLPKVGGSFYFGPGAGPVPLLHGVRTIEIVAVEEGGAEIARVRPPLPDWAELDRRVAEALPALAEDSRDFEAKCERESEPEI